MIPAFFTEASKAFTQPSKYVSDAAQISDVATLYAFIHKLPESNLSHDICIPDLRISYFNPVLQEVQRIVLHRYAVTLKPIILEVRV